MTQSESVFRGVVAGGLPWPGLALVERRPISPRRTSLKSPARRKSWPWRPPKTRDAGTLGARSCDAPRSSRRRLNRPAPFRCFQATYPRMPVGIGGFSFFSPETTEAILPATLGTAWAGRYRSRAASCARAGLKVLQKFCRRVLGQRNCTLVSRKKPATAPQGHKTEQSCATRSKGRVEVN